MNRKKAPCTASNGGRRIFQSITSASTVQVCSAIIGQIAVVRLNPLCENHGDGDDGDNGKSCTGAGQSQSRLGQVNPLCQNHAHPQRLTPPQPLASRKPSL